MDGIRIMIDPFSVKYEGPRKDVFVPFERITEAQAADIIDGNGVFRKVDLMLISHDHIDHYSLPLTVRFLKNHPETTLCARSYLVDEIRAADNSLLNPFLSICEADLTGEIIKYKDITLRAWATQHAGSGEYYRSSRHTTFRLDGSWSCVFLGDMEPTRDNFERIRNAFHPDVAIVPYLYAILRKGDRLLREELMPETVCYNHIPLPEGEADEWRKSVFERVRAFQEKGEKKILLDRFGMKVVIDEMKGVPGNVRE